MGRKSKNPFSNQTNAKQKNAEKILVKIGENGTTAREIREDKTIDISEKTINRHLKELLNEGKISFNSIDKKYTQTKKGKIELNNIAFQKLILDSIINKSKSSKIDYSGLQIELENCSLAWGIESNIIISKKVQNIEFIRKGNKKEIKKNILNPEDVEDIERLLYSKISKNLKEFGQFHIKYNKVKEALQDERLVVNFNINMKDIWDSIRLKSLEIYDNLTPDEIKNKFQINTDSTDGLESK